MTRRLRRLFLGMVCAGAAFAAPARADAPASPALRLAQPNAARFPEVTLYAYPTDGRGALITGLRANDFRVTENGRPAPVLRAESQGEELDVCLALDCSRSMNDAQKILFARQAAKTFVAQLDANDRAAFVEFGQASTLDQPLTGERNSVSSAIDRTQATGDATAFYDAVFNSVDQVALRPTNRSLTGGTTGRPDARRVVLAVTDGLDNNSHVTAQQVVDHARANGVSLCMVALGEDAAISPMRFLANETGGVLLRAPEPQELEHLYAQLAAQLRREYQLTIRSPEPRADGTRRDVHVVVAANSAAGDAWYQAPGTGSLLVTVPRAASASGPGVAGTVAAPRVEEDTADARVIVGALLMLVGLAGVLGAGIVWWYRRRDLLPIVDSNPRVDLLPLWVREGSTRVGRSAECELVLDSRQVSRVHARIEAVGGIFRLFDEGSSNGTWVNGRRVRRARDLRVGDVIRFGDREFRFAGELP